jgi:uncharacterized membrane protein
MWALEKSGSEGIEFKGLSSQGKTFESVLLDGRGIESATPDPGTYFFEDRPDRLVIKVGFSATDVTMPFRLQYLVKGAAKRYSDTAELYWQFIGTETGVPTDKVHIEVVLPKGVTKPEVRAWAHGPLTGVVAIHEPGWTGLRRRGVTEVLGPVVSLDVNDLPANTFVEGRVLFPPSALAKAQQLPEAKLQTILAQEKRWAEEANAERRRAQTLVAFATGVGVLVPLAIFGFVVWLFLRFGREYKPKDFPGGYFREIPADVAPPLVGALWRWGSPNDADMGATIMDLALQGAITMRPVTQQASGFLGSTKDEPTYELTLDRARLAKADPLERELADFLFGETMQRDTFTIHDLREHAKEHPQSFTSGLNEWKRSVSRRASELGWVEKRSVGLQVITFLLGLAACGAAVWALIVTHSPWFVLMLIPGLGTIAFAFFMGRRSREANELYAKYRGLRDYLRDFSRLDEKPPGAVVLWEKFLVLAVVFGIAEQVIAQMRVAVPDVVNDPTFATAYWWAYSSGAYGSPVSAVTTGMTSAVAAANSAMSSSSGGGGGFSGGGGGGGGGGGFSAG